MKPKSFDFGGWATKHNILCKDGRTIRPDAFAHQDGLVVPLVWQHGSGDPGNILGHAVLENRPEGVYAYCTLNDSTNAQNIKSLIQHSAINALSIYANNLKQKGHDVMHGMIREVSTVMSGANPGALIDFLAFAHSEYDDLSEIDEALIYSGAEITLAHAEEEPQEDLEHEEEAPKGGKTVGEILGTLSEEQKAVVGALLEEATKDDEDDEEGAEHSDKETEDMKHSRNAFDQTEIEEGPTLTHDDFLSIWEATKKCGSFKQAFIDHAESIEMPLEDALAHAGTYGLDNISVLFPDAQNITGTPDWIKRDTGWVGGWMSGTRHTPFSRIKTMSADITADEARAKGYVTGNEKKEEVFGLLHRTTDPTTVYKKQKLDRDDVTDITSFDVIAWLKAEMRMMLDEEVARAGLIGDRRAADDEDKIKEDKIRPVYTDAVFYAHRVTFEGADASDYVDEIVRGLANYKGSGNPNLYTTRALITDMLLLKDTIGRRLYGTRAELAAALGVNQIIDVEVMEGVENDAGTLGLHSIVVNPADYTYGADKGGEVNDFEAFDIDYNQQKFLIEGRTSGALTKPKSAVIFEINLL